MFKQDGVNIDKGQFTRSIQNDSVAGEQPLPPIDCRIDDVSHLDPLAIHPNALAGDQGSIEQILHAIVESIDLVA